MSTIILVKHSLSQINPDTPAKQWVLSAEGERRCLPLVEQLIHYQPDIIITSDEPKAIETGQRVAEHLAIPWRVRRGLHEHERQNAPFFPAVEAFRAVVKRFFDQPGRCVFGEETADETHFRFANAIADVLETHPRQTVALVTHGTALTLFVSRLFGLDAYPLWKSLTLPSFVVLEHPPWRLADVVTDIK